MPHHHTDIIAVAQAAGGPIVLGASLHPDDVIAIIQSTSAPITVKAGTRHVSDLIRIVQSGGKRVAIDFS